MVEQNREGGKTKIKMHYKVGNQCEKLQVDSTALYEVFYETCLTIICLGDERRKHLSFGFHLALIKDGSWAFTLPHFQIGHA